jgi:hypothetical protein
MDKTTKILFLMAGLLLVGIATTYPYERMNSEYIQVNKNKVIDALQPREVKCVDVEPQTIMINNLPHSKATPNHQRPCHLEVYN